MKKVLVANIIVFSIVAIFHSVLIFTQSPISLAGITLSLWVNGIAVVVLLGMIYFNYMEDKK